jgi:hypothetical protein
MCMWYKIWGSNSGDDVDASLLASNAEDGGSTFLQNIGIYLQVHIAVLPKRQTTYHCVTIHFLTCPVSKQWTQQFFKNKWSPSI